MFFLFSIPFYLSLLSRHSKLLFCVFFFVVGVCVRDLSNGSFFSIRCLLCWLLSISPFFLWKKGFVSFLRKQLVLYIHKFFFIYIVYIWWATQNSKEKRREVYSSLQPNAGVSNIMFLLLVFVFIFIFIFFFHSRDRRKWKKHNQNNV